MGADGDVHDCSPMRSVGVRRAGLRFHLTADMPVWPRRNRPARMRGCAADASMVQWASELSSESRSSSGRPQTQEDAESENRPDPIGGLTRGTPSSRPSPARRASGSSRHGARPWSDDDGHRIHRARHRRHDRDVQRRLCRHHRPVPIQGRRFPRQHQGLGAWRSRVPDGVYGRPVPRAARTECHLPGGDCLDHQ